MTLLPNQVTFTGKRSQQCDVSSQTLTSTINHPNDTDRHPSANYPHLKPCQPPVPPHATKDQPHPRPNHCPKCDANVPCQHSKRTAQRKQSEMRRKKMKNSLRRGKGVKCKCPRPYIHSYYSTDTLITLQDLEKRLESMGCGFSRPFKVCFLFFFQLTNYFFLFLELNLLSRPAGSLWPPPQRAHLAKASLLPPPAWGSAGRS